MGGGDGIGEWYRGEHVLEAGSIVVSCSKFPGGIDHGLWGTDGIDTGDLDATEDEREDVDVEMRASSIATHGYNTGIGRRTNRGTGNIATDGVNHG